MAQQASLITIVIPVYNRERTLRRTLDSISTQTSHDFNVILVDNNSTDSSVAIMRAWASSQNFGVKILHEAKQGAASARQTGLEATETSWTMFFDSDDTMEPTHVLRAAEAINANPEADIISWDVRYHTSATQCRVRSGVKQGDQYGSLFHGTTGSQRYCARTALFLKAGGWNANLGVWDDIELGARLLALEPRVFHLQGTPTVDIYLQPDSITKGESTVNITKVELALNCILATLGPEYAHWTALKLMILAAHAPSAEGSRLRKKILTQISGHHTLLRFAYAYTRLGLPGIARLLRPLMQ